MYDILKCFLIICNISYSQLHLLMTDAFCFVLSNWRIKEWGGLMTINFSSQPQSVSYVTVTSFQEYHLQLQDCRGIMIQSFYCLPIC